MIPSLHYFCYGVDKRSQPPEVHDSMLPVCITLILKQKKQI